MLLNKESFDRIRSLARDAGYSVTRCQYSGAETIDGETIVWFTVADKMSFPRRGARLGFSEAFKLKYTKPLVYICSVRGRRFRVACSRTGRTLSER